jgi:hypothetical protein
MTDGRLRCCAPLRSGAGACAAWVRPEARADPEKAYEMSYKPHGGVFAGNSGDVTPCPRQSVWQLKPALPSAQLFNTTDCH